MADDALAEGPTVLDSSATGGEERLAAGARAGEYEVERFLGAGAMGDVYAGRHPLIGKRVAIKVIQRRLAQSPEGASRFLREAQASNQVGHPNVVDAFALGRLADGRLYLVMDLLDGEPLSARLKRGRVAPAEALAILAPIAAALDAAHARGVVHRDLKPDNVFVSGPAERPLVHVLDFGIAKLLSSPTGDRLETLTGEGAWLGTPAFMAPEQWSADGAGPASDRYALGVMAYQLLAGVVPFRAASLPQMMEKHIRAPVPPITGTHGDGGGADLPPAIDDVLARAMAKDPDARFASAAELVAALELALGTARGEVGAVGARSAVGARIARGTRTGRGRGRAPRAAAFAGAGLVVIGLGAGAWMMTHDRATSGSGGGSASGSGAPATGARLEVQSTPPGARVRRAGRELGVTPLTIDATAGETIELELSKPGYTTVIRRGRAGGLGDAGRLEATLAPVHGFEGTWAMADGTLRAFERRGVQVAAYALERADAPRKLLRMFEFAPSAAGETTFTAAEDHVDERAPDEPSCHLQLGAEYHYQPDHDALALRKQRARYDLEGGVCVVHAIEWTALEPLRRIGDRAPDWAEATGASNPKPLDLQKKAAPVAMPPDVQAKDAPPPPQQQPQQPLKPPTGKRPKAKVPNAKVPAPNAAAKPNAPAALDQTQKPDLDPVNPDVAPGNNAPTPQAPQPQAPPPQAQPAPPPQAQPAQRPRASPQQQMTPQQGN